MQTVEWYYISRNSMISGIFRLVVSLHRITGTGACLKVFQNQIISRYHPVPCQFLQTLVYLFLLIFRQNFIQTGNGGLLLKTVVPSFSIIHQKTIVRLVQVVDNIERNHKLGLVFEFSVGKGKLLVCMSDLKAIQNRPEGRQFYSSILNYMESDKFNPVSSITQNDLVALFKNKSYIEKHYGS